MRAALGEIGNKLSSNNSRVYEVKQPGKVVKTVIADLDYEMEPFSAVSCEARFAQAKESLSQPSGDASRISNIPK